MRMRPDHEKRCVSEPDQYDLTVKDWVLHATTTRTSHERTIPLRTLLRVGCVSHRCRDVYAAAANHKYNAK